MERPTEENDPVAHAQTPRSRWIDAGFEALATGGPDAVRIEPLAQALGVTKGGFYWQFDNRGALLEELFDTWEHTLDDEIIEPRCSHRAPRYLAHPSAASGGQYGGSVVIVILNEG